MNPYEKLRPWTAIESCPCAELTGLVLFDGLTDNPLHCAVCKNEVDPERLGLSVEQVEAVAAWHSINRSLHALWLASGEYEHWAKAQLLNLSGQVNQGGLKVARMLSVHLPTCLWLFREPEEEGVSNEIGACPICGQALDTEVNYGEGKCLGCGILV